MLTVDLAPPERVLAIGAHADDIEFGCGATLAKWADAGARVTLCVCTDGAKGTWQRGVDLEELVLRREEEQRDAAAALGAVDVEFLRFIDGELSDTPHGRALVCQVIRRTRPDVVLGHDPWQPYRIHPDHVAAGLLTLAGIVAARDATFFPEQGMQPHRPSTLLCFEPAAVNHCENVRGFVDRKIDALLAHRSQWESTMGIDAQPDIERASFAAKLRTEARTEGLRAGLRAAESFARINDL